MQTRTSNGSLNYEEALEKVFAYKKRKQYSRGLNLLHLQEKKYKKDKIITGLLATFYYEKGNYNKSAKYFKKATILNPKSELSSLGLFHSLMYLGKIISALNELMKFTSTHKFTLYKTTISELKRNTKIFNRRECSLINQL